MGYLLPVVIGLLCVYGSGLMISIIKSKGHRFNQDDLNDSFERAKKNNQ